MTGLFPLRPLQAKALDLLKGSIRSGSKRIVIQAPTGYGKTILAAHIAAGALGKGNRAAFTVPMLSLIDQTFERFVANGIDPGSMGVMQGNHPWRRAHAPLQICSVQTLDRRGWPEGLGLVMVDECHVRYRAIDRWMAARPDLLFVGLSATPWARGMGDHWQELLIPATIGELIEQGWLSKFRVFAPSHPDLSGVKEVAGDYHEGQLSEVMSADVLVADVVQNWLDNGEGRSTLCFAVDRAHAAKLHGDFESVGVSSAYVDGETETEERKAILSRFQRGEVKVIVSIGTMTTGVDVDCRCIVLARPTKSELLYVQMIGRGLRTANGKDDCLIFDHSDTTQRLGFVTEIHHAQLRTAARDKAEKQRREEGGERAAPKPRECAACHRLVPAGIRACPSCGAIPQRASKVETVDGELVEFGEAKAKKAKRDKFDEALFFAQLKGFAIEKNYKPGWAAQKFKERTGVWPNGAHVKDIAPASCGPEVRSWIRSRQIAWAKSKSNSRNAAHAA
jgi:DNA repair protein RadD